MMIKDVIPGFELFRPKTVDEAVKLLDQYKKDAWRLAGGNDSISWMKDRVKRPKQVIDLSSVEGLSGIKETANGIEIGAMTTLTDIENNAAIKKSFRLLADAAGHVASPQIRNTGTLGGNINQDARCWYYRSGLPCYRAGGTTCFADTPEGQNREHAIFDAARCVAVTPSDVAPALVALDAEMVVKGPGGERVVKAEDYFIGPRIDITRMTQVKPEELLIAVRIPKTFAGANFYFEKVTDRKSWDFALVNVASAIKMDGGKVADARIVVGGVACTPRRAVAAEGAIKGSAVNAEAAKLAGQSTSRGSRPLNYNHFKIPLMANLVTRAVRDAKA